MPHVAMFEDYKKLGWQVHYIGSDGIEKKLVEANVHAYHTISTGKLRRYLSVQNFIDIFKVALVSYKHSGSSAGET